MRPVPVVFHLGPLAIHTYGIGLALTFWFGYRYFARRLRRAGFPDDWLAVTFVEIVVAAVVGARLVHVLANFGFYAASPAQIFAIWNGGLSSYGGLAFGVPVGFLSARRRCPALGGAVAADLVAPVLVAAWAIGRLLGPQLMVAGGGKPTTAWYGMYYAGEVGRRIPVPIFQAIECSVIFLVALAAERVLRRQGPAVGAVAALVVSLWNLSRFFDEYLWLGPDNGTDALEIASLVLFVAGVAATVLLLRRNRRAAQLVGPIPTSLEAVATEADGLESRAR